MNNNNIILTSQKTTKNYKEVNMGKKLLSVLLVVSIISSSVFGYNSEETTIAVITFQGPKDSNNVTISNLFAIELGNAADFKIKSGKTLESSYIKDYNNDYDSISASNYENEAIEAAKTLRVNYVLIGQINKLGDAKKLIVKVIDVDGKYITGGECSFVEYEELEKQVKPICVKIKKEMKEYIDSY